MSTEHRDPAGELASRIQRLEDIEEIRTLRFRYHHHVNQNEYDLIPGLYAEDAVIQSGEGTRWEGIAAIRKLWAEWPGRDGLVKHYPHNHIVEVDGDSATGVSYFEARVAADGKPLMVAGCYEETYTRSGGRWLIQSMILKLDFAVPPHVGWAGPRLNYMEPEITGGGNPLRDGGE